MMVDAVCDATKSEAEARASIWSDAESHLDKAFSPSIIVRRTMMRRLEQEGREAADALAHALHSFANEGDRKTATQDALHNLARLNKAIHAMLDL